ncbi:MAG: T9SS type A sorting domain-containing protein [Candidatus Cloacimonadales bacterium]
MKKVLLLSLALTMVFALFALDLKPKGSEQREALPGGISKFSTPQRLSRELDFDISPQLLLTTYYDYMPGSYNGYPLRILADGSAYAVFHAQETSASNRRIYYSFIESDGTNFTFPVGTDNLWEGYPGIDIDPVTNNPFAVWHADISPEIPGLEIAMTYDLYSAIGPGNWISPFAVIDSEIPTPYEDDEFIWPYTYIGPSPVDGKRRVYVIAKNATAHNPEGTPSENVLLAYADFDENDMLAQSQLDWEYTTIPQFDAWNAGEEDFRPFVTTAVSEVDGKIAFVGYHTGDENFILYNETYGEGEWIMQAIPNNIAVDNPQNLDGTYPFTDDNGDPEEIFFAHINDGNFNAVFSDDGTKLFHTGTMGLQNPDDGYYPLETFVYSYYYDFESQEFHFQVLNPEINENAANPNYVWQQDQVYLPWDTDNDGEIDEYDEDGNVVMFNGWPTFHHDPGNAFHDNQFHVIKGENGMLAALWMDGLNNYYAQEGIEGYEEWIEVAEIKLSFATVEEYIWSEPVSLNSLDTPELAGMKPAYVYPGDLIENIADNSSKIHLFFLDDDTFGGQSTDGGNLMYAAITTPTLSSEPADITPALDIKASNYPNPFYLNDSKRGAITIKYNLPQAANLSVEIYNLKGQKVDTLLKEYQTAGSHELRWQATDHLGKPLASGVYFYKISGEDFSTSRKMLIIK